MHNIHWLSHIHFIHLQTFRLFTVKFQLVTCFKLQIFPLQLSLTHIRKKHNADEICPFIYDFFFPATLETTSSTATLIDTLRLRVRAWGVIMQMRACTYMFVFTCMCLSGDGVTGENQDND